MRNYKKPSNHICHGVFDERISRQKPHITDFKITQVAFLLHKAIAVFMYYEAQQAAHALKGALFNILHCIKHFNSRCAY